MIERDIIGIFGKMNSGKSSLMNLITQQEASIVDPTPGTTSDTKITIIEIHGLGPVKLMDTAGFDEKNELGDKKRNKSLTALKECDLILLVINPATIDFETEKQIIKESQKLDKQVIIVYNIFDENGREQIDNIKILLPETRVFRIIVLSALDNNYRQPLLEVILENYIPKNTTIELLPFVEKGEFYILNIPMDEETPTGSGRI